MRKRILATVLSLFMILGIMPTTAWAAKTFTVTIQAVIVDENGRWQSTNALPSKNFSGKTPSGSSYNSDWQWSSDGSGYKMVSDGSGTNVNAFGTLKHPTALWDYDTSEYEFIGIGKYSYATDPAFDIDQTILNSSYRFENLSFTFTNATEWRTYIFREKGTTPPAVDSDWDNVYLDIATYKWKGDFIQSYKIAELAGMSGINGQGFKDTIEFEKRVYHPDTKSWTMDVTVEGYNPSDTNEPYSHAVNYMIRGISFNGWGLAPGEQATKTITLTYFEKAGNKSGWYAADREVAELPFYVAPLAPDEDTLESLLNGKIKVDCITTGVNHADGIYGLIENGYTPGTVAGNPNDGYTYTIILNADTYAEYYDTDKQYGAGTHTAVTEDPEITFKWNDASSKKKWEAVTPLPVIIEVECETTPTPTEPAITGFTKELMDSAPDGVTIPDGITYPTGDKVTIPADGSVTLLYKLTVTGKPGASFTITDNGATLVGSDCGATQTSAGAAITGQISGSGESATAILYVTKTFTADNIEDGKVKNSATVETEDEGGLADGVGDATAETPAEEDQTTPTPTEPSAPGDSDLETLLNGQIRVDCITTGANHSDKTYGLIEGGYQKPVQIAGDADTGWTYVITLLPGAYVEKYNADIGIEHALYPSNQTGSITLTWDEDSGWTKPTSGLSVTFTVKCETATLTYDANGGTFGDQETFAVSGISATENYELGKENGYTDPTRTDMVFMGWTTDKNAENEVYAAGEKIPDLVTTIKIPDTTTVYAVWGEDENDNGTADALQIVIQPADITIYAGGAGYDGVVKDQNGNLVADSESTSTGLPEPGYYFTLPYELDQYLKGQFGTTAGQPVNLEQHIRLTDATDPTRQWILQLYDGEETSSAGGRYIYRLAETATGNSPAKLQISDGNAIVTSDEFFISSSALYQEYQMSLYTGAASQGNIIVEVSKDGSQWNDLDDLQGVGTVKGLSLTKGTLTIRGAEGSTPTLTTNLGENTTAVANNNTIANEESKTTITAVVEDLDNATFTINGSNVRTDGQIALYTDGLLPNDVLDNYLKDKGILSDTAQVDYQYLDLVDTSNGNAYVTTDSNVAIYWKLPANADPDDTFHIVHFNGLDRNYDVNDLDKLIGNNDHKVTVYSIGNGLERVEIEGEQYLKFTTSTFSPFALVYDAKDEPVPQDVTVTFRSGAHGTFSRNDTKRTVTIDVGDHLTRDQIPTVYEDRDYTFIGWYISGESTSKLYSSRELQKLTITEDTTFIAKYRYEGDSSTDDDAYEVIYHPNFTNGGVPRRSVYDVGDKVTVSENRWFDRDGYIFIEWNTKANGTGESYDPDDTFKMPDHDVNLYAQWEKETTNTGSIDTDVSDWLNTEDHYAYIAGYEDGTVRPEGYLTRAEVATIFFRLLTDEARENFWSTQNSYSDVAREAWYNNAISTMTNAGILGGYEDNTFRPNNSITRAEFATIAARFLSQTYTGPDKFSDISGHWAAEYINRAAQAGWVGGYADGTYRPDQPITRAEAVTLINAVLDRAPHKDHLLADMIRWPDNPETAWYYAAIQEATNSHDYRLPADQGYEEWTVLLQNRDWSALEQLWSQAN